MVSTSLTAAAFVVLSAGSVSTAPNWQADYGTALTAAAAQQKPMAVFIGQGDAGYANLVTGGQIPVEVGQLLSSQYVSVYVNTDTAAGKALAGQFEMQAGLVISSRGGAKQALRLPGTVNGTDLTGVLTTLGTTSPVSTTGVVVSSAPAVTYVAPAAYAVPSAPLATYAAPAAYSAPAVSYAPPAMTYHAPMYAPVQSYAPMYAAPRPMTFGSSCANGRCGR